MANMTSLNNFLPKTVSPESYPYETEYERHIAQGLIRMIRGVLVGITISVVLSVFVLAPASPENAQLHVGGLYLYRAHIFHLATFIFTIAAFFLINRFVQHRNLSKASIVLVALLFAIAFLNYIPQQFADPIVILVTMPLVAAGVLLSAKALRNTILAVIGMLIILFLLNQTNVMSGIARGRLTQLETTAYVTIVLIVNGIMINVFSGYQRITLQRNLLLTSELRELNKELEHNKAELEIANSNLEARVEERTEQLRKATEEAERANRVKSAFLASMSHELRTPLNAIINFSKFLKKGIPGPLNAEQDQLIGSVADSGQHLLNLINDVLDMSKIESGSLKLYVEADIDLREIITAAVQYIQPILAEKPVELRMDIAEELPSLTGDRKRLLQIVLNILSNACKFTENGHVSLKARAENGKLLLSVEDTGPGIATEDSDHVFTAFKQTQAGLRQGNGTGLGMPICKKLVEAHDGRIWFESQLDHGTTFYVELPLQSSLVPERSIRNA